MVIVIIPLVVVVDLTLGRVLARFVFETPLATRFAFIGKDTAETVKSALEVSKTLKVRPVPYGERESVLGIYNPIACVVDLASQPPACKKPALHHACKGC